MHPDQRGTESRSHAARFARVRAATIGAAVALALAACGQSPSIAVTLDSASPELLRGADVQITVTLTRAGGANGDVSLGVTGLPANVDATFSPATLSGGASTSTLTLSAASAAAEGVFDLNITGTGPGLTSTAPLQLEVVSLTVTGRVVTFLDFPLAGVAVGSQGDTEITGASGSFTLTGLSVPYDLSLWNTADEWVHVYEGLTSNELLLTPFTFPPPTGVSRTTTVSGNLNGGVIPVAANQTVLVCVEGVDGVAAGCDVVSPTESAYGVSVEWVGDPARAVHVHALQVERDAEGLPVSYQGYSSLAMTLTDGVPARANLDLGAALATTTVDLDVQLPAAVSNTVGAVRVGPRLALPVMLSNSAVTTFEVLMPVIGDASYSFVAVAGSAGMYGWQADVTEGAATVSAPAAPTLVGPADLATGVTTATDFTAANPTGGPITYEWRAATSNLAIGLTTMASTVTIPDLTEYGLALPAAADFTWEAVGSSGTSTEAGIYATGDSFRAFLLLYQGSPGMLSDGTFAPSGEWRFSTAP